MTTDLVQQFVNPSTGEVVTTADATDLLAQERRSVVAMKRSLDQYAAALDEELVRRLDKMGRRSAVVGGWKLETKAATVTAWDEQALLAALGELVGDDLLDPAIVDEVLPPVTPAPRKLDRSRANTLLRHPNPHVRAAIEACVSEVPQRRPVSVQEPTA
jgi:hypothetical protein